MEKYLVKNDKISTLIYKFSFFLIAIILITNFKVLSGFIESTMFLMLGLVVVLIITLLQIVLYFKKGEDYITITEDGLKTNTKFNFTQECKFTDKFKYNYRRKKLKSIIVSNEKNKTVLVAFNRYEIKLSELKNKIEEKQKKLNIEE